MSAACASAPLYAPARRRRPLRSCAAAPRCAGAASSSEPVPSGAPSGGAPLAWLRGPSAWFATVRTSTQNGFSLAGKASAAALVANLRTVPPSLRAQAGREARAHSAALLYSGDEERMDADLRFYSDGFALLARDLRRDGHLLFRPTAQLTPRQLAARQRLAADARSLLPFLVLVSNTWPFTMAMLEPALQRGLPRHWVLPSSFEHARLRLVHRARRLGMARQDAAQ